MRSELEQTIGGHPCPVGGRTVFREYDSYEICPFCGWEDNAFQEAHPYTGGGPNASLHSCRRSYRKKIAVNPSYTWAKEQDELCLKKGIFWIVDRENLKNNEPYLFRIPVDPVGIPRPLAPIPPLNSKNGDSYNHKQTWKEYVPAELRGGKPYNYYPRGRVEIKDKGKTKIFLNPDITAEDDGNDKAFVILTGLGGSTDGFGNKYSQIAEYVQSDYGFPVFIAPTPEDVWEKKEKFFDETVARFIQNKTCIYLMGVSAGATIALWYAAKYPQIERVLCVNPVLNINLHMTSNGVRNFSGEKLAVVFGEKDPSAKWAKLLPALPCLKVHIIPDADHVFSGKLDEFIDLPKKYLFA